MTLFFWFNKPLNVETPTTIEVDATMAELLFDAREVAKRPWYNTPLDFVDSLDYTSQQMPLGHLWSEGERPISRIPNDRDTLLHNWKVVLAISIPTAAFGTFQLIAWNFAFPTRAEQMLWRYTCLGNGMVLGIGCALEAGAIIASNFSVPGLHTFRDYKLRWPYNVLFFVPGLLYFAARAIIIIEVMISLRRLDAGCFDTVQWTQVLPHI